MDPRIGGTRVNVEEEDEVWGGNDDDLGHYSQTDTDLEREWEARRNHFHTLGYRDGISAGKESEAQVGFNLGFKEAVGAGYNWGIARGATSAFAALTPSLKELVSKNQDAAKRLENLNSSIYSISSDEAMRIYYEESVLQERTTVSEAGLQNVAAPEASSSVVTPVSENEAACCDGRGDCDVQRLSLDPTTDDEPTRPGETSDAGPCSNSSRSSVLTSSSDEETISDVGYLGECSPRPDLSSGGGPGTSDVNRPCTRLERLQGEVKKEFQSSVVKLRAFPHE